MRMFIAALLVFAAVIAPAAAELTISPLRQVLDEETPIASYRVSNPSRRIVEGRVSWTDLTAAETGYLPATGEERARLSAAPYLTVWPAFFRLEPGAHATITVAVRDGAPKVGAGEKRSHLVVQTAAPRTPLRKAGGGLELDIGVGISTPVILRHGDGAAKARLGETRLLRNPDGLLELETVIEPGGSFSAYGKIEVYLTERGDGDRGATLIAHLDNVAAYLDAPKRRFTTPLGVRQLPAGLLEVRYAGADEFAGKIFAERSFKLDPPK